MTARYGYAHRKARSYLIAQARISPTPVICWRCEEPIYNDELPLAECGHVIDAALMQPGMAPRYRLEHRACNRAAGYALGRELMTSVRNPNKQWETSEITR
jgi:hypothetical protein